MDRSFMSRFQEWLNEWSELKTRQVLVVVLAVLMGLLAGMVVYTISKAIINDVWSYPPGLYGFGTEADQKEQLNNSLMQIYICTAAAWIVGTLGGSYCATRVAKMGRFPAWIAGVLLTAYYWIDLLFQPHNLPQFLLCPVLVGICAYGGGWLGMYVTVRKQMKSETRSAATPEDA
ncbi:MAG TPA: hypothetical protein VG839_06620 [Asticcacaulis sp.]|nr:hypothetical protein [Asticcacaulis sp.]